MKMNVITVGVDTPAVYKFGLRGEFKESGLLGFDYISLSVGDESYTTFGDPDSLFIDPNDSSRLYLKIGAVTQLTPGEYHVTIKGFSARYQNGHELISPSRPLVRPLIIE